LLPSAVLPLSAKHRIPPAPRFRWAAGFCALLVLALGLLAISPQLHAALHGDANHQDHACAVTLFSHGVETAASGNCLASTPALFPAGPCAIQPALPVAEVPCRLPPGCGPPLC
jgi:hypothetical protein